MVASGVVRCHVTNNTGSSCRMYSRTMVTRHNNREGVSIIVATTGKVTMLRLQQTYVILIDVMCCPLKPS